MAVSPTWTNPESSPPDTLTGATLTQTAWEDALGDLDYLGGSDGKHGQHGGLPFYRNSADTGKELQLGNVASTGTTSTTSWGNIAQSAVTFTVAFSANPVIVATGQQGSNLTEMACAVKSVSGSGFTPVLSGVAAQVCNGSLNWLAIGAP